MIPSTMVFPAILISGIFYIFVIWVLWMIVKCLKGINASLKKIAQSPDKV
jgi:hypothetical protein